MSVDNPILNGCLYKKIEAAERLDEITPSPQVVCRELC